MFKKVDHIAIAVKNLEETREKFEWLGEYRDATPEERMTKVWG